jgi:epoxyqueuosine reductase QueG
MVILPHHVLFAKLEGLLKGCGLTFMACADLSPIPECTRSGLPFGICLGVRLRPSVIAGITHGPTPDYSRLYVEVNRLLDELAVTCSTFLRDNGHAALPFKASDYVRRDHSLSTPLPHKTVGTLAGVGWIGKCALLVTESFGSAVRYTTVLTDAPLPVGTPVTQSKCGDCTACVEACPASAPRGNEWWPGLERHGFYDAHACRKSARAYAAKVGIEHPVCGICIAACPYTKRYLLSHGIEGEPHETRNER